MNFRSIAFSIFIEKVTGLPISFGVNSPEGDPLKVVASRAGPRRMTFTQQRSDPPYMALVVSPSTGWNRKSEIAPDRGGCLVESLETIPREKDDRAGLLGLTQEDIIVGEAGGIGSIGIGGRKPDCRKLVRVAAVGKVTASCWGESFSAIFIFG